ncbi:ferritin-like domain-containing protein [Kitasatospora sp. NBC_00070]|uniref:ferritin-like domain-containing protein n=1 Tax=Kitasatospora sp. NBC_00070 TaxID=2975962 RepID=UPI00386013FD
MLSLTRRSLLLLGALSSAPLLLCGCTDEDGPTEAERKKADADLPLRGRAVADTDRLLAGYDAVLAGPGAAQADRLRALRAEVAEHRTALATGLPTGPTTPTAAASGTPTGPATSVAELAAAERSTAGARLADLTAASPELAKLLAAVSAAGALHAAALGNTTPVTGPPAAAPSASPSPSASGSGSGSATPSGPASPTAAPRPAAETAALQSALSAEHAAVYGYGVVGARQPAGPQRAEAQVCYLAHQARRDAWQRLLLGGGATPAAAAPGYQLPFPVTDPATAKQLAAHIEVQLTGVYAALVAAGSGELRQSAAAALRESALRARQWGAEQSALPGLPAADRVTTSPSPSA